MAAITETLLSDRRTLLVHVLKEFESKGGKVVLPIGVDALDEQAAWVLDKIDIDLVLATVRAGSANLDLILYQRGPGTAPKTQGRGSNLNNTLFTVENSNPFLNSPGPASRITGSEVGDPNAYADGATSTAQPVEPVIDLPQLKTALQDDDLKHLAYTMFVACGADADDDMVTTVASQLEINQTRANQISKTLKHVAQSSGAANGPMGKERLATLELQVKLLERVRPKEFGKFKDFVRWRDTTVHVVVESLVLAMHDEWVGDSKQQDVTATKLIARLHGAKRRVRVEAADEFDEGEYSEAVASLVATAGSIVTRVRNGWRFPWGLRVRICELLLRGAFDTLEEGYIEHHEDYVQLLQGMVWPVLGVTPPMHKACYAWVHFRQWATQRSAQLAGPVTFHIKELAATSTASANGSATGDDLSNRQLAAAIGEHIIDYLLEQLGDYRMNFKRHTDMQVPLDMLSFATRSQGKADLAGMLLGAVGSSMDKEISRQHANIDPDESRERQIEELAGVVQWLLNDERKTYSSVLMRHLPEGHGVAAYRLHHIMAQKVLPWIGKVQVLTPEVQSTVRTVRSLEEALTEPVQAALRTCESPSVLATLREFKPWDTAAQLHNVLANWVQKQLEGFGVWVQRQLADDRWEPISGNLAHSTSSQETLRFISDSIDTLFDMQIPLPPSIMAMHMEGSFDTLIRYAKFIHDKIGPWSRLIPRPPPITRFKQSVAAAQEEMETSTPTKSSFGNLFGFGSKKKAEAHCAGFCESVPKVESSPDFANVSALTLRRLSVMVCSLQHLLAASEPLEQRTRDRYAKLHPHDGPKVALLLDGLLEGLVQQLNSELAYVMQFLAVKAVFWDQRRQWLEVLYRYRPAANPIDPLLDPGLVGVLTEVIGFLPDALHDAFAEALLKAVCQALERVLLDGGPMRLYKVSDAAVIEKDLAKLKALFFAEGEGISQNTIEKAMSRFPAVLAPMKMGETALIIELKRASDRKDKEQEELYVRVAAHRAERAVSKHLKTAYNLPKRLKGL